MLVNAFGFADDQGHHRLNLLCSTTLVTPLKPLAVSYNIHFLSTELEIERVKVALYLNIHSVSYLTDSQIVHACINSEPFRLTTFFVANSASQFHQ